MSGRRHSGGAKIPAREVPLALGLGVFILPIIFVWPLQRAGYSARVRVASCVWLGVSIMAAGIGALLSDLPVQDFVWATVGRRPAPAALAYALGAAPIAPVAPAPRAVAAPAVDEGALSFTVGKPVALSQVLRAPITLTNNTGAALRYAEIDCVFYDEAGGSLGRGMANFVAVKAGETVSGEVMASGVDLAKVDRRECRTQSQAAPRAAHTVSTPRAAD